MIRKMMAVKDRAAQTFGQPFFTTSVGQATRSFQDELNRRAPDNILNAHPEDFDLYHIADFDDDHGTVDSPQHAPQLVAQGKQLITKDN